MDIGVADTAVAPSRNEGTLQDGEAAYSRAVNVLSMTYGIWNRRSEMQRAAARWFIISQMAHLCKYRDAPYGIRTLCRCARARGASHQFVM